MFFESCKNFLPVSSMYLCHVASFTVEFAIRLFLSVASILLFFGGKGVSSGKFSLIPVFIGILMNLMVLIPL